jgi:membrane protein required for colicin V production
MNPLDILIVVVLLYGLIRGIFSGLIRELAAIFGVLAGGFAAFTYYRLPAFHLKPWVVDPSIADALGFAAIFISVWGAAVLLGVIIRTVLEVAWMKWVDRICGALFGVLKGVLIAAFFVIVSATFLPPDAPLVRESRLAPYLTALTTELVRIIPRDVKNTYRERIRKVERQWRQKI